MKSTKYIIGTLVVLIGVFFLVRFLNPAQVPTNAVGDTNTSPRMNQIVMNGGSTATTTTNVVWASFFNGDSTSRIIQEVYYNIAGLETNIQVSIVGGTSTTATGLATTSLVYDSGRLGTSTPTIYNSTTSPGNSTALPMWRVWPAGQYLNFVSSSSVPSATSTTLTGSGIIGVKYTPGAN